jgi:hypothetical protein
LSSLAALASLQCLALKLNQVTSASDGSTNIYPGDLITFTWTRETGDPAGFDVNLLYTNGTLGGLRANVDLNWGTLTVPLGDVPPEYVLFNTTSFFDERSEILMPYFLVLTALQSTKLGEFFIFPFINSVLNTLPSLRRPIVQSGPIFTVQAKPSTTTSS